jgi:hypothetical protein
MARNLNTPAYREKRRIWALERARKLRVEARAKGLCPTCCARPKVEGKSKCAQCLASNAKVAANKRKETQDG